MCLCFPGLKIKIPKDIITNCQAAGSSSFNSFDKSSHSGGSSSRKRERSAPSEVPASKLHKSAHKELKQNGRHSSNKVSSIPPSSSSFPSSSECDGISEIKTNIDNTGHCQEIIGRNNAPIEKTAPHIQGSFANTQDEILSKTTAQVSPLSSQKGCSNPVAIQRPPYFQAAAPSVFKSFNNNSQLKTANRQSGSLNKHVRHNYDQPPPPYQIKDTNRHSSELVPPRHNSYPQMMPYAQLMPQMGYGGYHQVVPPVLPNVSMPPPPFGYFPSHFFDGYMYQQPAAAFGVGVGQPPLPTDAPPVAEVPPPPPPE